MIKRILKSIKKPIHYKDEYLEILRRVNAGMLHYGNILCLDYAIRNIPSENPILEIGTFCGLSANIISYFKKIHLKENNLISIGEWPKAHLNGKVGKSDISYKDFNNYVKENLIRNLVFFSKNNIPYVFENTSDIFFDKWEINESDFDIFNRKILLGGKISFAYIDGNHSYEYVKRDFENCDRILENGGFILFDDSSDFSNWDVRFLIREIKKNKKYILAMKNPNYLFQKVK